MTIELKEPQAVASFLKHVADLIAEGRISALSLDMQEGGSCRASVVFRDGLGQEAGDLARHASPNKRSEK